MPHDRIDALLRAELRTLHTEGRAKGAETVLAGIEAAQGDRGPRYRIEGEGAFLRMNANNYLGLSLRDEIVRAEHDGVGRFGAGPGAVRFISGTWTAHVALERRLAAFHGREAAMVFSSAYAAMIGLLPQILPADSAAISDALNHNCIINGMRLARPRERHVYPHLDLVALEARLAEAAKHCTRAVVVTDGIFSMRGDHAPLDAIATIIRRHDADFAENILLVVDDSHGVGAFGATGRGTEEVTGAQADILVGTLGKAFGVNGGYIAASQPVIDYLRETAPTYVYSNPISPGEAAAAARAVDLVDSVTGGMLLDHLHRMAARFRDGLHRLSFETLPGAHPIVPLLVRDTGRTNALVAHLRRHQVLATGLAYPVVPRGDEEIRFQICADHTEADIDETLSVLETFLGSAP
ncbi:MAG TPA: aminotransferase class I/II-fold pyridoxal phosphate-dependent enzyme [Stellaceae bacterium]